MSPKVVNWVIAVIVGVVFPFGTQNLLVWLVSLLDTTPIMVDNKVVYTGDPVLGVIGLTFMGLMYIIGFSYQIRYIALLKTHSSVFAFVLTISGPVVVLFVLPLILGV